MPEFLKLWGLWNWVIDHSVAVKWTDIVTAMIAGLGVVGGLISYNRRTKQEKIQDKLTRYKNFVEQEHAFAGNVGIQRVRSANTATLDLRGRPFRAQLDNEILISIHDKVEFHGIRIFNKTAPDGFDDRVNSIWQNISFDDKCQWMTFYERLQLLVQFGLMSKDLAFFTFGVEYLSIYRTKEFWIEFERPDDPWWGLNTVMFKSFEIIEKKYERKGFPLHKFNF